MHNARLLAWVLACFAQTALALNPSTATPPVQGNIVTRAKPADAVVHTRHAGTVGKVDPASYTVYVDGVAYVYAHGSAFVHGGSHAVHSHHPPPIALSPGMKIEFASRHDPGAARPRITDIWLTPGGTE
jgi:hypothetical protein